MGFLASWWDEWLTGPLEEEIIEDLHASETLPLLINLLVIALDITFTSTGTLVESSSPYVGHDSSFFSLLYPCIFWLQKIHSSTASGFCPWNVASYGLGTLHSFHVNIMKKNYFTAITSTSTPSFSGSRSRKLSCCRTHRQRSQHLENTRQQCRLRHHYRVSGCLCLLSQIRLPTRMMDGMNEIRLVVDISLEDLFDCIGRGVFPRKS